MISLIPAGRFSIRRRKAQGRVAQSLPTLKWSGDTRPYRPEIKRERRRARVQDQPLPDPHKARRFSTRHADLDRIAHPFDATIPGDFSNHFHYHGMYVRMLVRIHMTGLNTRASNFLNLCSKLPLNFDRPQFRGLTLAAKTASDDGNLPDGSASDGISSNGLIAMPPTSTKWHPTPSVGLAKACVMARSNAGAVAMRVALVKIPSRCARMIPSFTPRVKPKSSALRINCFILIGLLRQGK